MPEIAEVARIVHFIRKHLVGKTLSKVTAFEDNNVYGKAGTSSEEFQKAMNGKKVVGAGQQGKYFWMVMSTSPHPLMHFGMAGWLKIKSEDTYYYRKKAGEPEEEWPPKYMKFLLETNTSPKIEAAFVDFRRFGRIRLLDCPESEIRKISPLCENGPDPVVDKDLVTESWLLNKCRSKKVPIKALLLDQANISGIGNWVGDEIMYHAKIHPEQYSNSLSDAQLKQLHTSIHHICSTAVELLGDSDQFPESWLFKHRWSKGKKDAPTKLPNGDKIVFLTVGGRTSAVIPNVQKKTGPVAKEMSDAESGSEAKKGKRKAKKGADEDNEKVEKKAAKIIKNQSKSMTKNKKSTKEEENDDEEEQSSTVLTNGKGKGKRAAPDAVPKLDTTADRPTKRAKETARANGASKEASNDNNTGKRSSTKVKTSKSQKGAKDAESSPPRRSSRRSTG